VASAGPHASLHLTPDRQPHPSTPPLSFLQAGCPSCRPTNSVKALKARALKANTENTLHSYFIAVLIFLSVLQPNVPLSYFVTCTHSIKCFPTVISLFQRSCLDKQTFFLSTLSSVLRPPMVQWKKHTEPALCQPTKANYMQSFPEGIKELLTLPK